MLPAAAMLPRVARALTTNVGVTGGAAPTRVLLGTSGTVSKGIYSASWDAGTGKLGPITLAAEVTAPTFLARHQEGANDMVYAVSETGGGAGAVTGFVLTPGETGLRKINTQLTGGDDPTHVSVTPDGRVLAVANYTGGSVTSFHIGNDGAISAPVSHFQYSGTGPNKERQEKPHAHSAQFSPDGKFLLVNDLGLDRINVYKVNAETGELTPGNFPMWVAKPGTGPRHIAFHPGGKLIYSVNELSSTVDVLRWDARTGHIEATDKGVSTLPADFPPNTAFAGEIVISADGQNLYVGNRIAAETIAVFTIENGGSKLKLGQLASNGGKTTRHIAIDPTGRWMLLSDQGSGAVVVLARDPATGNLSEPKGTYPLDKAMFAVFV